MKMIDAVVIRLKNIMSERKITPYYFSKEGGIAKSTVYQVFNGKQQKIMLDLLFQFTSTLGITLKEFFDDPIFNEVSD